MKCEKCGHEIKRHEFYVVLKDEIILDESCFFDKALKELRATSKQESIEEE